MKMYEVVYPLGQSTAKIKPAAASIPDLSGKTICGSGHSYHGDMVIATIVEALQKKYSGIRFIPNKELPDETLSKEQDVALQAAVREKGCNVFLSALGG